MIPNRLITHPVLRRLLPTVPNVQSLCYGVWTSWHIHLYLLCTPCMPYNKTSWDLIYDDSESYKNPSSAPKAPTNSLQCSIALLRTWTSRHIHLYLLCTPCTPYNKTSWDVIYDDSEPSKNPSSAPEAPMNHLNTRPVLRRLLLRVPNIQWLLRTLDFSTYSSLLVVYTMYAK